MVRFPKFLLLCLILFAAACFPPLYAQTTSTRIFDLIVKKSGYIFAGTVLSVERKAGGPSAVDTVQITFRVDQGIRGVRTGQSLTIREWSGLWTTGDRYLPGQRLVLFLYHPSRLGLTSPVGSSLGQLDIDRFGKVILGPAGSPGASTTRSLKSRISVSDFAQAIRLRAEE